MSVAPAAPADIALFGRQEIVVETQPDGTMVLASRQPLPRYPRTLTDRVRDWAEVAPDRVAFAERDAAGAWRTITYAALSERMRRVGAALLARGLSAERPVMILSGNSIAHAVLALGAMDVGIPYVPISVAYSTISKDFGKLRYAVELLTPGLVYAADGATFGPALEAVVPPGTEIVTGDGDGGALRPGSTDFADLCRDGDEDAAAAAHERVTGDTIAKFLLTSGSTGVPKAVINTHRMLAANQAMIAESMVFLKAEPPVLVDWLPWSHTFGSNHNLGIAIHNGGSVYIDAGRPLPGAIDVTVRNLEDVAPTVYFNVPKGFEMLLPALRADSRLRERFFSRLRCLFYAGASLSQPVWEELKGLARQATGRDVPFVTSLGSTETAPAALFNPGNTERVAVVGLPMPGVTLKLAPVEDKLEARLKGDSITPGYWRRPDLTAAAFDEEGFYRLGDALKPAVPGDITAGLVFDGRIAEDFKLATGTWVNVGMLRGEALAALAPFARDVVVTGHDRDDIGLLIFPDLDACRSVATEEGARDGAAPDAILDDPGVKETLAARLSALAARASGSSMRVARALCLEEPPSIDTGEMTDKGSINQRAVLARRRDEVEALYATEPPPQVILVADAPRG